MTLQRLANRKQPVASEKAFLQTSMQINPQLLYCVIHFGLEIRDTWTRTRRLILNLFVCATCFTLYFKTKHPFPEKQSQLFRLSAVFMGTISSSVVPHENS